MTLLLIALAAAAAAILVDRAARRIGKRVRLRLRRRDGRVYLDRWGFEWKRLGGIFIHRMAGPDPARDIHDHPWFFLSLILRGGYIEKRASVRAIDRARHHGRKAGSLRLMRLDEAHTITHLNRRASWSLVIHGPKVRPWGFYVMHPAAVDRWTWIESSEYISNPAFGWARDLTNELAP